MTPQSILCVVLSMSLCARMGVVAVPTEPDGPEDDDSLQAELMSEAAEPTEAQGTAAAATEATAAATEATAAAEDTQLLQQAEDNASAIRRLADVMNNLIYGTSSQRCMGTGANTERLTDSIKEGFSLLVGAVRDLNNTVRHFKDELSSKVFVNSEESAFESDGSCPFPFFMAGEDCIYIETEVLRYFDAARHACIDMGAKLAEFETFEPFTSAVENMDLHEDAEIYIGGTDREREGTWRWLSGAEMRNVPWGYDEPNNLYLEDCIALRPDWRRFNDIRCDQKREYVCQWTI